MVLSGNTTPYFDGAHSSVSADSSNTGRKSRQQRIWLSGLRRIHMDPVSKARVVENNQQTTRIGGVTGKGFRPGQSGNPGGRKKKLHFTKMCEQLVKSKDGKELIKEVMRDILNKRGMAAVL